MKAIGYKTSLPIDDPQSLIDVELPMPEPGERDLRVRVEAVAVNPVDTKMRMRQAPMPGEVNVLGWDVAGVVEAVGGAVTGFKPGDEVWYAGAIDRPGANAQYHCVDARIVSHKPKTLSFAEAAALPLTSITAWELLFDRLAIPRGEASAGEALLVIGAGGGVGSILVQLARRLTGLTVIGTASRPETRDWVRQLGAHHVIDHRQALVDGLKAIDIPAVNYVMSLTQTSEHFAEMAEIIAPQGKLGVIDDPKSLDILPLKRKCISVHWEFMFARSLYQTPDMIKQQELLQAVADMVDRGEIRSTLAENFGVINAQNLRRAHQLLESGKSRGKIVLAGFG